MKLTDEQLKAIECHPEIILLMADIHASCQKINGVSEKVREPFSLEHLRSQALILN